jgi:hypothetical protein
MPAASTGVIGRSRQLQVDDALDQLSDAVLVADHLGDIADHLIGHFVDQARRSGASWTEIGKSMGVTKQAARKRFVPKVPGEAAEIDASDGFSRIPFDAQAKKVLELTFREALRMGHNYIGTEHILLTLLEFEDGSRVLTGLGLDKTATETSVTDAPEQLPGSVD